MPQTCAPLWNAHAGVVTGTQGPSHLFVPIAASRLWLHGGLLSACRPVDRSPLGGAELQLSPSLCGASCMCRTTWKSSMPWCPSPTRELWGTAHASVDTSRSAARLRFFHVSSMPIQEAPDPRGAFSVRRRPWCQLIASKAILHGCFFLVQTPILNGREPTASDDERRLGSERSAELSDKVNQVLAVSGAAPLPLSLPVGIFPSASASSPQLRLLLTFPA